MDLIELLQPLIESPDSARSFNQYVFHKYFHCFNETLNKISQLADYASRVKALRCLLYANRRLIAGTLLDYTASAYHPITQRCIEIAKFLAQTINQDTSTHKIVAPIELLYPNFNFLTDSPHHLQLGAESYERISLEEQHRYIAFCRTDLKNYKQIEQELKDLEQHPDHTQQDELRLQDLRKKLFDTQKTHDYKIYSQVARKIQNNARLKSLVGQGSHIEVANKGVIPNIEVQDILASHILSFDNTHLIPVKELEQEQPRHVYDEFHDLIIEDELIRMEHFNHITKLYTQARKEYQQLISNKSHLLGNLVQLHDLLKFNDAHSGIGKEFQTGAGSYTALIQFQNYYAQLSESTVASIPQDLRTYIDKIFKVASELGAGQTCTGLMREDLAKLIYAHQSILVNIGTDDKHKSLLLQRTQLQLDALRKQAQWISSPDDTFAGDALGVSSELLYALNVELSIDSLNSWYYFMSMSKDAIVAVLTNQPLLKVNLAMQLCSLNEWLSFFKNYSIAKIQLFFHLTSEYNAYYNNNYNTEEWAELLVQLPAEKFQIVVEKFAATRLLKLESLTRVINFLSAEQQALFISAIIKSSLKDYNQFYNLFSLPSNQLNAEQRSQILLSMDSQFGNIIIDFRCLYSIFKLPETQLNAEQRSQILLSIDSQFGTIIRDSRDLYAFFTLPETQLNSEQRSQILSSLQGQLYTSIIISSGDLYSLFSLSENQLKSEHRSVILSYVQNKFGSIIRYAFELHDLLSLPETQLNQDHRAQIFLSLQSKMGTIIQDFKGLNNLLMLSNTQLNSEQRSQILDSVQSKLSTFISSGKNLYDLFSLSDSQLHLGQRSTILVSVQSKLSTIISSVFDICNLFSLSETQLNQEHRSQILISVQDQLSFIIGSGFSLNTLFSLSETQLNSEQRTKILLSIQSRLSSIIRAGGQLKELFSLPETHLSIDQRNLILSSCCNYVLEDFMKRGNNNLSFFQDAPNVNQGPRYTLNVNECSALHN